MNKIIGQDKNYDKKIPKSSMEEIISDFKNRYSDHKGGKDKIIGFEINGGLGLTEGAKTVFSEFEMWCKERQLIVIYNTLNDMNIIETNLKYKLENKNKY